MSYSDDDCRDSFTNQQAGRMHCWTCDALPAWLSGGSVGACCSSDGSCMDTTPTCCGNVGETFLGGGTACGSTGDCCMGDGSCEVTTEACCTSAGGSFDGTGTTCATTGACCLPPDPRYPLGHCEQRNECYCDFRGGLFFPNDTCGQVLCPTQTGPQPGG